MVRDIAINEDRRTTYNTRGDLENATGEGFLTQQLFIAIFESVDMSTPGLSNSTIEEQRGDIEQAVIRNQFTEQPISVTVESINSEDKFVKYSISTSKIEETFSTT